MFVAANTDQGDEGVAQSRTGRCHLPCIWVSCSAFWVYRWGYKYDHSNFSLFTLFI